MRKNQFDVNHKFSFHLQPQHEEELKTHLKPHAKSQKDLKDLIDKIEVGCDIYIGWKRKRADPLGFLQGIGTFKAMMKKLDKLYLSLRSMAEEVPIYIPRPGEDPDLDYRVRVEKKAFDAKKALEELVFELEERRRVLQRPGRRREEKKMSLIQFMALSFRDHIRGLSLRSGTFEAIVGIAFEAVGDRSKARDHRRLIKEAIKNLDAEPPKKIIRIA